ncbi:MAG: hypothetical protein H6755_02530 [Candidatus Omnitrophica bacterium]|nr:hypothetical protein [Candidatus Omnitrophota bacterium]
MPYETLVFLMAAILTGLVSFISTSYVLVVTMKVFCVFFILLFGVSIFVMVKGKNPPI